MHTRVSECQHKGAGGPCSGHADNQRCPQENAATAATVGVVLAVAEGLVATATVAAVVQVVKVTVRAAAATPCCHVCIG